MFEDNIMYSNIIYFKQTYPKKYCNNLFYNNVYPSPILPSSQISAADDETFHRPVKIFVIFVKFDIIMWRLNLKKKSKNMFFGGDYVVFYKKKYIDKWNIQEP